MSSHFPEVMVKNRNALNAMIYRDGWMYVGGVEQRPLYFAPYYIQESVKTVERIDSEGISVCSVVLAFQNMTAAVLKGDIQELAIDHKILHHFSQWLTWANH